MIKTKTKQKILIITSIVVALIVMAAIFYFINENRDRVLNDNSVVENDFTPTEGSENNYSEDSEIEPQEEAPNQPKNQTIEAPSYSITGLNIKDGDYFSVPDEVSYTISSDLESSRIILRDESNQVIYQTDSKEKSVKINVYPSKKVAPGASGSLTIEGVAGGKVVVSNSVKVVF